MDGLKMGKLIFGVHNHQPVGNFMEVVEGAIDRAYAPFIEEAEKVSSFKFALHFSGWLLKVVKEKRPELFKKIKKLVEREQVELFTGGFYEPILPSIPSSWRRWQVEKLSNFIEENFGVRPKGLWLAERVWEDSIVKDLVNVGVEYVVVDDYHLISTGLNREELNGPFISESEGYRIVIFPIDMKLRYLIPFRPPEEVVKYLNETRGKRVLFDDGEKFGIWPGTYRWVYEDGWLKSFLSKVSSGEVETFLFKDVIKDDKPKGPIYIPTVSYYEMGEWALRTQEQLELKRLKETLENLGFKREAEKFLRGGIWKNFFSKYRESNYMHKRMLELSLLEVESREFKEEVAKSQCNDPFWHGIFGGIYLPHLRDSFWESTVRATEIAERERGLDRYSEVKDLDYDGYQEVILSDRELFTVISTKLGGGIVELSIKDKPFNFQNTLTRRPEGYHFESLEGERESRKGIPSIHELRSKLPPEVQKELVFDWHEKVSFISHLTDSINAENFRREEFRELGDFANQPFELVKLDDLSARLRREGGVYLDRKFPTLIEKAYRLEKGKLEVEVSLETSFPKELLHVLELNFHFKDPSRVSWKREKKELKIFDGFLGKEISILLNKSFNVLSYRIETFNRKEDGFERTVQGISFGLITRFKGLEELKIELEVKDVRA